MALPRSILRQLPGYDAMTAQVRSFIDVHSKLWMRRYQWLEKPVCHCCGQNPLPPDCRDDAVQEREVPVQIATTAKLYSLPETKEAP